MQKSEVLKNEIDLSSFKNRIKLSKLKSLRADKEANMLQLLPFKCIGFKSELKRQKPAIKFRMVPNPEPSADKKLLTKRALSEEISSIRSLASKKQKLKTVDSTVSIKDEVSKILKTK
jgi:hypothetical protein